MHTSLATRLASLSIAAVMTLFMFASIHTLATNDALVPAMAAAPAASAAQS